MVSLVALLQTAQNRNRVLNTGFANEHLLEPALQSRVLFDVLAVLIERRRTHQPQFAAGQHGLEHIARIHCGVPRGTCTDERVDFVDEGHNLAFGVLDLLKNGLHALFELAAVLGTGDHGRQVKADQLLAAQTFRDVACDHALRKAFDDSRLAHTGLTDEHRIVLGAARQNLDDPADLRVTADDGVEFAVAGLLGQVEAILFESLEGIFRVFAGDLATTANLRKSGQQRIAGNAFGTEQPTGFTGISCNTQKEVFGRHVLVAECLHFLFSTADDRQPGA